MRRPILNQQPKVDLKLNAETVSRTTVELNGLALEKRLKQQRSQAYIEAMTRLDAAGAVCDRSKVQELIQSIQNEFGELKPHQFLIGIVAKCYLGAPYEVHTLDMRQEIVQHYKAGQPLPSGMERARGLAMHPSYSFVEVYSDSICAVAAKGYVAFTRGGGNVQ
ncbi:hypothetical protein N0M98_05695 [Paenibacillus doosanensis]|uniref:Uncharacterized protein n=1 Tax=Paenibacillus konkukensis TaxID=2020716 RepID=A0ABY4RQC2_9BACL|nr:MULTISPECIES: hypothetical protein [Paenibacillus]MCS7459629.1 hypothetical protein [Paenibacillus doosanensis]UQZ84711.1 hypothetical protein SK3146_03966 [Paenibacillus konkukensis]